MTENSAERREQPPGNVIAEMRVEAGADVIPGPETLRQMEEAGKAAGAQETGPVPDC